MVPAAANADPFRTAFTVSVDALRGTSTGISASDRARTLVALGSPASRAADLSAPGHVFPLRARAGGVLVRGGHTEAAADLAALAGDAAGVGVLCEVCDTDAAAEVCGVEDGGAPGGAGSAGSAGVAASATAAAAATGARRAGTYEMLRLPALTAVAAALRTPLISVADLQRYRLRREVLLREVAAGARYESLHGGTAYDVAWEGGAGAGELGGGGVAPGAGGGVDARGDADARGSTAPGSTAPGSTAHGSTAPGSTTPGPSPHATLLRIRFASSSAPAAAPLHTGPAALVVTVHGDVSDSGRGRASVALGSASPPSDAAAHFSCASPPSDAAAHLSSASHPPITPPEEHPSSVSEEYPCPPALAAALARLRPFAPGPSRPWCDRALAELCQAVRASLRCAPPTPALAPHALPLVAEAEAARAAASGWPSVRLDLRCDSPPAAAAQLQALRLWQFGLTLEGVELGEEA